MSDQLTTPTELVPQTRRQGDALLIAVQGEVDLHNAVDLRTALLSLLHEKPARKLVLNLEHVPYMDSSGIAVLVEALAIMRRAGGKIYLAHLQPRVKSILEIARLQSIFVITPDEDSALKA